MFSRRPLAEREQLRDDTQVLLGRVDRHPLDGLVELAVDRAGHHLRLADGELEPLAAHHLHQHRQLELAAPLDLPSIGTVAGQHAGRDVAHDLLIQAPLHQPRGQLVAVLPGRRRGVDADRHGERWLVNMGQRQRPGIVGIGERLPDRHLVQAGHGDDLARPRLVHVDAVELFGDEQLHDLRRLDGAVGATPGHGLTAFDGAVPNPAQGQPAEVRRRVEVRHQRLERVTLLVFGGGDVTPQCLEQRLQVVRERVGVGTAPPGPRVGVQDGELDLLLVRVKIHEQLVDLVDDVLHTSVGTVDLVDDQDHGQVQLERFPQDERRTPSRTAARPSICQRAG